LIEATMTDPFAIAAIFTALALGGLLKGAIGLGSPILAVPVMATVFDVRTAVVLMVLPNLITNIWQFWAYRGQLPGKRVFWLFGLAGGIGALLGTVALSQLSGPALSLGVAGSVIAFVLLRIARPNWRLGTRITAQLAIPVGVLAGLLQGASGVSAPVMVSFLNAIRLERLVFIAVVSLAFLCMALVQVPLQVTLGLMTWDLAILSLFALIPLLAFMPIGAWLARRISAATFDRIVLVILSLLAAKLIWDAVTG